MSENTKVNDPIDLLIKQAESDDNLRPAPGFLIARVVNVEVTTAGGIHLPKSPDVPRARIVKIGEGRSYDADGKLVPFFGKVGETFVFSGAQRQCWYKGHLIAIMPFGVVGAIVPPFAMDDVGALRSAPASQPPQRRTNIVQATPR